MEYKKLKRAKMVRSMEMIVRSVNDEELIDSWLMFGVADGDIDDDTSDEDIANLGYTSDETFKDLMDVFIRTMYYAYKVGGLYCTGITSVDSFDKERRA